MLSARRLVACLLSAVVLGGCATGSDVPTLRVMVPNSPGGGYDTTARMLASVWEEDGGVADAEVFNLPGAGGVVGLSRLELERGDPDLVMMMGLGVVGALQAGDYDVDFGDVTPVARILSEPNVLLVRADSRFATLDQLVRRWRSHPGAVIVGGGSLPGGPDHLATFELAEALGIDPGRVQYRSYDGGGPLLGALLSGEVEVVMSGVLETVDQVRSGSVRPLAVTGPQRLPGFAAPTLRESGIDVVFENWRGLLAPPGISREQRERLVELARDAVHSSEWQATARRNGWRPELLVGDDFGRFLTTQVRRTGRLLQRVRAGHGKAS